MTTPSSEVPLQCPPTSPSSPRRPWLAPSIETLPKLTDLTLASPIGGGGGIGGSTVFGLLLAAGLLFGISACNDNIVRPNSGPGAPAATAQALTCRADVRTGTVDCTGPARVGGTVTLGGQGVRVALRSTNVAYDSVTHIFSASITVQNLLSQTLGGPGGGVNVFFESGPNVSVGTGTVTVANPTGTNGTFDGTGQTYFLYPDSIPSGQTSPPLTWEWNVPGTVTSFVFTVLVSAEVEDDQGVLSWLEIPQFKSDSLVDIAVNSSTDVMAVGRHGTVLHKVGTQWNELPVQSPSDWVGIAAIGGGEYIGATAAGTVLLFDGKVWKTVRNAGFNIAGITAYATNRIAIGGDSGGSPHLSWFGQNGWFSIGLGGSGRFAFLASYAIDQGVGATIDGSVNPFNFNSSSTSGTSSDTITAFYGAIGKNDFGRAMYGGGIASIFDQGSGSIYGPGVDTTVDAIDFGSGGPNWWAAVRRTETIDTSVLMSYTGGVWSNRAALPARVTKMIQDSVGGLYLLSQDGIRRWNGSSVVDELVEPQGSYPTAIGAASAAAYVGMNNGDIRRYAGGAWTTTNPGGFLRLSAIQAFSATSAAALDTSGQFSTYDGSNWSFPVRYAHARALWGIDPTHLVLLEYNPALSGTSYVEHGDPNSFSINSDPAGVNTPLNAAWGTSDADFWVVGNGGVVLHYNGTSYTSFAPGTSQDLLATAGTGNADLWVAGTGGYLAHWDNSAWTTCGSSLGGATVTFLWALGTGAVYAGQADGTVTRVDAPCTPVVPLTIPGGSGGVMALSGASSSDLWAIVGTGIFHGSR